MFELVLRLKSDYVCYFYYALFVPFKFHLIIDSISHFKRGLIVHVVYIYVISSPAWDSKRLDQGGVRSYYTMFVVGFYGQFYCSWDLYIFMVYIP